ncbi:alpha/beta fold hydrolase [Nonomuraea sp. NPDC050790]|uniref:alpha/beta fold hydrolase n=1 Tax=Nonomuraea sp. NPDC050790 TaxID=3364371 RepID=UPI0037A3D57F
MIGDAIAAEWLKFRTLRSNLWLLAASLLSVLVSVGVAAMVVRGFAGQDAAERMRFTSVGDGLGPGLPVALFVMGVLGALSVTAEYATGQIRTSLAVVPKRHVLLLAKVPVLLGVGLTAGPALAFCMHYGAMAVLGEHAGHVLLDGQTLGTPLSEPAALRGVLLSGVAIGLVTLVGLGLGALVRSTAGTLVILIMIVLVLPTAAAAMPRPWNARIGSVMLDRLVGDGLLPPASALALLLAYPVAALSAGAVAIALRGRRAHPLIAGLACTGVLLATVVVTQPAQASAFAWKPCQKELECGSVQVPVDWDRPSGRKITLPLVRLPATGAHRRIGTVFALPGGPGGSGIEDLEKKGGAFAQLRQRFDVVSFTPRNGLDLGVFSLDCLLGGPWIRLPANEADFRRQAAVNRAAADECRAKDPELFANLDSASVARDVEAIRIALGEDRLSFLATSYGGVTATNYARLFPARVRAMVMDGSVNLLNERRLRHQVMEGQLARFAAWCAGSAECVLRGQDVLRVWREVTSVTARIPVRGRQVTYDGFDVQIAAGPHFISPGEDDFRWKELAKAIKLARAGDASGFADYVKAGTGSLKPPSPVGMNMTHCLDGIGFRDYADFTAARSRNERMAPGYPQHQLWHGLACPGWPVPATNPPRPLPSEGLPPLLGAASWTEPDVDELVRQVPGSATIRFDGHGHGLYLSAEPCVIGHVNRYLTWLKLPPPGAVCRS